MPKVIEDQQLYQAILQTVTERGYAGATTKQMAIAAGVSEATLFRKYGSKAQLVKQAIASIIEQTSFATAPEYTGNVQADLLRVVEAYQASSGEHGQFFAAILSEIPRYPDMADLIDVPFTIFKSIAGLLERYQAEGILRREHPLHALAALLGPVIFIGMMRNVKVADSLPAFDLAYHVEGFISGHQ